MCLGGFEDFEVLVSLCRSLLVWEFCVIVWRLSEVRWEVGELIRWGGGFLWGLEWVDFVFFMVIVVLEESMGVGEDDRFGDVGL